MRVDDCDGARCRADGVFLALARDFVGLQMEQRAAINHDEGQVDVVSVILMINDTAKVLMLAKPLDWVLYNRFLHYREWSNLKPGGKGFYLPALAKAEELLHMSIDYGACALSLLFFSDCAPADRSLASNRMHPSCGGEPSVFAQRMGCIAAKFGRRLTIQCIGMASTSRHDQKASVILEEMVREAYAYGAIAVMTKAKLTQPKALSGPIRSMVSSMTSCKANLTHPATGLPRRVKTGFLREKIGTADDMVLTSDWQAFLASSSTHYLRRIWAWNHLKDTFDYIMDPRCIHCFKLVASEMVTGDTTQFSRCPDCKACFICHECQDNHVAMPEQYQHHSTICQEFLNDRRHKAMIENKNVPSFSVALKKLVFSEGAERLVRQFRYLDDQNNFVGPKWVAKESRFIDDEAQGIASESQIDYHRDFMRSQMLAHQLAADFNQALDDLAQFVPSSQHAWLKKLPRIRFLEPLVVELVDDGKKKFFLIESKLEGRYRKFNDNMGYVNPKRSVDSPGHQLGASLEIIAEGDGDDESVPSSDIINAASIVPWRGACVGDCTFQDLSAEDFPQAFSHWSYTKSNNQLLVVDLQGVLQTNDDGTREFLLTDPAIHKQTSASSLGGFGQTDRGKKGILAFWKTHVCTDACKLLGLETPKNCAAPSAGCMEGIRRLSV